MKFSETPLMGVSLIDLQPIEDERGYFSRLFCANEFRDHGLEAAVLQANTSYSRYQGTLRGLHYQLPPMRETKLVRCIRGRIYDVVLDLREGSSTFGQWHAAELSASNRHMLFVPRGCAHGFLTLEDDCEVIYLVSQYYSPELERGIRWDDPQFAIQWPIVPLHISARDRTHPDFSIEYQELER